MKRRISVVTLGALLVLILLVCITALVASKTPRMNASTLCQGAPSAQTPDPGRTFPQATPEIFTGSVVTKARPYREFYRDLLTFQTKLNEVYNNAYTGIDRSPAESAITQYLRDELYGKHITQWQGWIVETGVQAIQHAPYQIDPSYDYSRAALVSMSDPFTTTMPSPIVGKNGYELPRLTPPYVFVANATEASGQQLCLGQEVTIDGDVAWSPRLSFTTSEITLPTATLAIQEDKFAGYIMAPELKDVVIQDELISGWTGGIIYKMTLYGDGTLIYFGKEAVKIRGYRITNIGEASIRQILAAFDNANFTSMVNYGGGCCDHGTEYVTLTRGNLTKTVMDGSGPSTPKELGEVEDQIRKLTHLIDLMF